MIPKKPSSAGHIVLEEGIDSTIGKRFNRWPSIIFLSGISLISLIGCPVYIYFNGIRVETVILTIAMIVITTTAITAGYHRLYSHKTYDASPVLEFLLLGFGAATLQQSALKWSSLHRTHHQFTDTERDPYNIKKGFFYAHVGWILFWLRNINFDNVKDLQKKPMLMHQHYHFQVWALVFGVGIPAFIGLLYGHVFEAVLFGTFARLFIVFQSTFFINSFAHTFGNKTFSEDCSARDNWLGAILTGGEGYHSFHHQFPNDYRNGFKWYHWDPCKWFLWTASRLGLASHLRRTPEEKIAQALAD